MKLLYQWALKGRGVFGGRHAVKILEVVPAACGLRVDDPLEVAIWIRLTDGLVEGRQTDGLQLSVEDTEMSRRRLTM